jgi:RNA polymerase sigma factor (sigma-70 family)
MIAIAKERTNDAVPAWHSAFLALLPSIVNYANRAFCRLTAEAREDAIQEAIANCLVAFVRLTQQGKADAAYSSVLVGYAVKHYFAGRRVGNQRRRRDVYSRSGGDLRHIGSPGQQHGGWREQIVENRNASVADLAAFRLDFPCWLQSLPSRDRRIALLLADGESTKEVARRFQLSPGRVSQLRRKLAEDWSAFHGENVEAA